MADRVAVLKDGKIRQVGTPLEIYRNPADAFIANFIGETNFVSGKVLSCANGLCEVETALGVLKGASSRSWERGSDVQLSMRPEALTLIQEGNASENVIDAELKQTAYLGEISDNLAEGNAGCLLKFFELNPKEGRVPGTRVRLGVRVQDIVILPPGGED